MKNKIITSTETRARKLSAEILRENLNIKRLFRPTFKSTSINCYCGETQAIELTAKNKNNYFSQVVGICKQCSKNNLY